MLVHNYYDKNKYKLAYFEYKSIPECMLKIIEKLNNRFELILRGGISYILITEDYNYPLKDIDLAMKAEETEGIYEEISSDADDVYFNKNTFGDDVITLFWNSGKGPQTYFKIDILLLKKLPKYINIEFSPLCKTVKVMDPADLWYNKLCKIAEKEVRGHNKDKTLNHLKTILAISRYLLKNKAWNTDLFKEIGIEKLSSKISDSEAVLKELIPSEELVEYSNTINEIKGYMMSLSP